MQTKLQKLSAEDFKSLGSPPDFGNAGVVLHYLGLVSAEVSKVNSATTREALDGVGQPRNTFRELAEPLVSMIWGEEVASKTFSSGTSGLIGDDEAKAKSIYDKHNPGDVTVASPEYMAMSLEKQLAALYATGRLQPADFVRLSTEPDSKHKRCIAATLSQAPAGRVPDHVIAKAVDDQLRRVGLA